MAALESGAFLREGKEGAIETALGWALGSIDAVRSGREPTLAGSGHPVEVDDNPFSDPEERALYVMFKERLPELTREDWIFYVGAKRQRDEFQRLMRGEEDRTAG